MKKASRIFYKVAGILSIIVAILSFIIAAAFVVFFVPQVRDLIEQGLEYYADQIPEQVREALSVAYNATVISCMVGFAGLGAFNVVNAVVSLKGGKLEKKNTGLHIVNIVFAIFSCVFINIVGAVLGLIGYRHDAE